MDLRHLLPWRIREILKTTPESWRESDGQVQEDLSTVARSASGQCESRSLGGAAHRAGSRVVWSGDLLGHGGLRTVEGRAAAALPAPGAWHTEPRHLQPSVPSAQARSLRACIPSF